MACRGCWGNEILLSLVLFLIVLSFCHGTRLTKRKALDKARGAGVKSAEDSENLLEIGTGYQADMGWGESKQPDGRDHDLSRQRRDYAAVKHLLQMDPKVECTGNSMKLQVQDAASTPGSLLFVDRGSRLSPLPLSHLPASCGYSIRSTPRDLVLVAPYDGCFVALEEDTYVLPLRWGGLPVKMSCPLMKQSSPNPPIVTCHAEGMVVKMDSTTSVADIKVKLTGDWEPLMTASPRCGFSIVAHPEGVVISVHYAPCLKKKDGMYTLELAGDGDAKISCPSMSPAETTKNPVNYPTQQTGAPTPAFEPPQTEAPQTPAETPTAGPKLEAPQGQKYHPFYHYLYPQPEYDNKPATKPQRPPQPQDQVHQIFHTQPESEKTTAPKPSQPEVYQPFNPYYQLMSTVPPKPQKPEVPWDQVHQPFSLNAPPVQPQPEDPQEHVLHPVYYPFDSQPENEPSAPLEPPKPQVSQGQVQQVFPWKPAERPTAAPPQPEDPQSPVYCPKSCPSGLSNCCVQIAFHQHLHHIVPAKETGQVYTGLPFLPSGVYSGFDQGLGFPPLPQMPTTTSTSAPVHSPPIPCKNRKQPPDSNPDAMSGSNPSNPTYQQPSYPYVVPNPMPQWPNEYLQTLPGHYSGSSQPQIQSNQVQHGQPSAEEQNKPLQSNSNSMDSEELRHNQAQHEPYNYLVPHYLQ
uniref:Pollen-specific leucine-rich repeat extensin-like protein 1 n=1 Tax=Labrus bergylta TaxID=56723 RepID=A0A3Q3EX87_9LABR